MRVGEVCNRTVVCIGRDAAIREAAELMRLHHVGDLVVVDTAQPRKPVGILTDRDIVVGVLAVGVDHERLSAGDVMSDELVTGREDDEVLDTIERMRAKGVRRLPVVDAAGDLAGILAVDDLIDLLAEQLGNVVRLIANESREEQRRRR